MMYDQDPQGWLSDFFGIAGWLILAGIIVGGTALYAFIQWAVS